MKKVLFVAGCGGHVAQLSILLQQIGDRFDSRLMLEKSDTLGIGKFSDKYSIYTATAIRGKSETVFMTVLRILINSLQSVIILFQTSPDYIITTGPGLGIPICLLGKFFGIKIIVIESWSRTSTKSIVGKALNRFADIIFVQWPSMIRQYPNARYAGRLG